MKTSETVPLFTLRSIWHRHLKETAIILAQPKRSSKGCDENRSSHTHSTGAASHRRKADSERGAELDHTLRPCSDKIRALKRQIIFPPTYNIHWNTRAAEEHAQRGWRVSSETQSDLNGLLKLHAWCIQC